MTSAPEFLKENVVALTKMNWGCSDSKMPLGLPTFYRQKVCWENYSAIKAGNFLRKKWGISGGRVKTPYCKVKWPGEEKLELGEGIHTLARAARPGSMCPMESHIFVDQSLLCAYPSSSCKMWRFITVIHRFSHDDIYKCGKIICS